MNTAQGEPFELIFCKTFCNKTISTIIDEIIYFILLILKLSIKRHKDNIVILKSNYDSIETLFNGSDGHLSRKTKKNSLYRSCHWKRVNMFI